MVWWFSIGFFGTMSTLETIGILILVCSPSSTPLVIPKHSMTRLDQVFAGDTKFSEQLHDRILL